MAMTTLTGNRPGLKRAFGRLVRLRFATMLVVQTVGVAFELRRKRVVSRAPDPASDDVALTSIFGPLDSKDREDRSFAPQPIAAS
jgi:hypothetical protein